MKYIIRERVAIPTYVRTKKVINRGEYEMFVYTPHLAEATKFGSVNDAIDAIIWYSKYTNIQFSILGVVEVIPQPEFKEVAL